MDAALAQHLKQQITLLTQQKQYAKAKAVAIKLVQVNPKDIEAWYALSQLQLQSQEYEQAITSLFHVCQAPSPVYLVSLKRLVDICLNHGFFKEGLEPAKALLKIQPDIALNYYNYAFCLTRLNRCMESIEHFKKAIELDPQQSSFWRGMGGAYFILGLQKEAKEAYENAIRLNDDSEAGRINLYGLNNVEGLEEADVFEAHKQFASRFELSDLQELQLNTDGRRIRIGYLSEDFKCHSVSFYFTAIIESHSTDRFEVFCYSDVEKHDVVTKKIMASSEHWRDTRHLSDQELFEKIREDGIDILVDLVGYVGKCRMGVFGMRAAPVQVTYLGYPNTTGLSQMDFRLTDQWADPEGHTEQFHSEKLIRLPHGFLCYTPGDDIPEVAPVPALKTGHICFGSFNSITKITEQAIRVWSEILSKVPTSTLFIKAKPLEEEAAKQYLLSRFAEYGIASSRIEMMGWAPLLDSHLELYGKIDIHLDSFPYNGTTTTCEALWQGVPTIALAGGVHRSRVGVSILRQVGLGHMIAESEADYVDKAVSLANDIEALKAMRTTMRDKVSQSSLMDRKEFIGELEGVYDDMVKEKINH